MIDNFEEQFQIAKERLDILSVAEYCGLHVNKQKFACCPFHHEKTPSMSLQKKTYFHCFGCGKSGDAISLVSEIYKITPLEALKQLNRDFYLGLNLEKKILTIAEKKALARKKRQQEQQTKMMTEFRHWCENASRTISKYIRTLHQWEYFYKPNVIGAEIDERYIKAVTELPRMEYLSEMIDFNNIEMLMGFYNNYSGEVAKIEQKFKKAF